MGKEISDKYYDPKIIYTSINIRVDTKKIDHDFSNWKSHKAKLKALKLVKGD